MKTLSLVSFIAMAAFIAPAVWAAEPALTIYNQDFAVVREIIPLDLQAGVNSIRFTEITAHLEPDSVMLRDRTGRRALQILEQNYRSDPISQELLLSLYEGQTIEFLQQRGEGQEYIVSGKIVRSGYVPHPAGMRRYGPEYYQMQTMHSYGPSGQPIIEVNGKLRFQMPGTPLFPALTDDTILKPTLHWLVETDQPGKVEAELAYVTGGMSWEADYNLVAPAAKDVLDLVGWVTMDNQSGRTFENARIKLMAGDVSKLQRLAGVDYDAMAGYRAAEASMRPPVTERTFDEYHLYTLTRATTLRDRETKQVEFVRAGGIRSQRFYIYDGAKIDSQRYRGWSWENIRRDRDYGTQCNPKIWVMREFANSEENHLGMPLPRGRLRFYQRDEDGQLEFTGENVIDHTPKDETVRVYTGDTFDLVGERRRMDFNLDESRRWLDESFEIKLRNHKKEPVEVRVVEHLYREKNWTIVQSSSPFEKTDSETIEFRIPVQPDAEVTLTYQVHYTW